MSKKLQLPCKTKATFSPSSVPPDKRRKTEYQNSTSSERRNENSDLWNDNLDDLPEDVLEDFEIMASQAIEQQQTQSNVTIKQIEHTNQSYYKPYSNKQSLSVGKGKPRSNSMPMTNPQGAGDRSIEPSLRPATADNALSKKNNVFSKNAHGNCSFQQTVVNNMHITNPTLGSTGSGKVSPSLPTSQGKTNSDHYALLQKELNKVKNEVENQKIEMQKQKNDKYSLEGQIKMLRESLTQKDTELFRQKQERQQQIEQQIKQRKEREKSLQHEVDRLKIQLQFKEQEIQSQQTYGRLERQLKHAQGSSPNKTLSSPRSTKKKEDVLSPCSRSKFPTRETFMGENETRTISKDASIQVNSISPVLGDGPQQKNAVESSALKVRFPCKVVSGPDLMSKLVNSGSSVFDLLQKGISSQNFGSQQHEGSSPETSKSQPAKTQSSVSLSTKNNALRSDNISLAYQGLSKLLQSRPYNTSPEELNNFCACDSSDVVLMLPVIDDYLCDFLEVVETGTNSFALTSTSNKTGCATVDSVTSSMKSLHTGENDDMDNLLANTLNALQILQKLVCYSPHIRDIVLRIGSDDLKVGSSSGKLLEQCSKISSHLSDAKKLKSSKIVQRVINICNLSPSCVHLKEKMKVIESALGVISALCQHCQNQNLTCLQPLLTLGAMKNHLDSCRNEALLVAVLDVLTQMVKSEALMERVCHTPDYCVFSSVYSVGIKTKNKNDDEQCKYIHRKVIQFLSGIISVHRHGPAILLDNDCQCSVEVVECIILMLYQELHHYKECNSDASLVILSQGIRLLHGIKQFDMMYLDHHMDVEHEYVDIICSLNVIFRRQQSLYENEISILQDLTDFDQDDPDSSTDSDQDDVSMDTR